MRLVELKLRAKFELKLKAATAAATVNLFAANQHSQLCVCCSSLSTQSSLAISREYSKNELKYVCSL